MRFLTHFFTPVNPIGVFCACWACAKKLPTQAEPVLKIAYAGWACAKFFFILLFLRLGGPRPHIPFPPDLIFVCKFSRHGSSSPVTSHLAPSITVLVFPDSADAYTVVAQLSPIDLHNFLGQILESSQVLGASKLPLLEWTSLNAGTRLPPNQVCVSYLSAMILLFLDPQF